MPDMGPYCPGDDLEGYGVRYGHARTYVDECDQKISEIVLGVPCCSVSRLVLLSEFIILTSDILRHSAAFMNESHAYAMVLTCFGDIFLVMLR